MQMTGTPGYVNVGNTCSVCKQQKIEPYIIKLYIMQAQIMLEPVASRGVATTIWLEEILAV